MEFYKRALELFNGRAVSTQPPPIKNHYTVYVMGSHNVGKASLVSQLLYESCPKPHCKSDHGRLHRSHYPDGVQLDIVETTSDDIGDIYKGDGFILVYSATDPDSFHFIEQLQKKIKIVKKQQHGWVPKMLVVANKVDKLMTNWKCANIEDVPEVKDEGLIANIEWNLPFLATSAKRKLNIGALSSDFIDIVIKSGRFSTAAKEVITTYGLVGFGSPKVRTHTIIVPLKPKEKHPKESRLKIGTFPLF